VNARDLQGAVAIHIRDKTADQFYSFLKGQRERKGNLVAKLKGRAERIRRASVVGKDGRKPAKARDRKREFRSALVETECMTRVAAKLAAFKEAEEEEEEDDEEDDEDGEGDDDAEQSSPEQSPQQQLQTLDMRSKAPELAEAKAAGAEAADASADSNSKATEAAEDKEELPDLKSFTEVDKEHISLIQHVYKKKLQTKAVSISVSSPSQPAQLDGKAEQSPSKGDEKAALFGAAAGDAKDAKEKAAQPTSPVHATGSPPTHKQLQRSMTKMKNVSISSDDGNKEDLVNRLKHHKST